MDALTLNTQIQLAVPRGKPAAQPALAPAEVSGKPVPDSGNTAPPALPEIDIPQVSIEQAVRQIQDYISQSQRDLQFFVDEASGRTVVSVYGANGELIRQYPSEEVLKIAANLQEQGINLIDQRA